MTPASNEPKTLKWIHRQSLSSRLYNTLCRHYWYQETDGDKNKKCFTGEWVPEAVTIIRDLRLGRLSPKYSRGYGAVSHAELCAALSIDLPDIPIKVQPGWKFHPITGEALE